MRHGMAVYAESLIVLYPQNLKAPTVHRLHIDPPRTAFGPQNDHASAEAELVDQRQLQPHAIREAPLSHISRVQSTRRGIAWGRR